MKKELVKWTRSLTIMKHENYIKLNEFNGYVFPKKRNNKGVKSNNSLNRAFNTIHKLIYLNLSSNMAFLTLTFADNIIDYDIAIRKFRNFIQRWRRTGKDLKYLAVWEHQEERGKKNNDVGAIHFHVIVFNYESENIGDFWNYGFYNVKMIPDLQNIQAIGNYLGGYLSKQPVAFNRRMYFTSRNLKRIKKEKLTEFEYKQFLKYNDIKIEYLKNKNNRVKIIK